MGDVLVNAGSGLVQEATGLHANGATVLDKCYTTEVTVLELQSPTTNGWAGSVEYSTDGGAAYTFLTCTNCGVGSSSEFIVVDGNADGAGYAPTECLNGDACSFVQAPTPSPTPAPTPPPTPAPPSTPLLCSSWCAANTNPFSVKVTWENCKGCTDSSTPTPTPAPSLMCSSWCAANTNPFSVKVTWDSCNGCTDPSTPTPTPAPSLVCLSWCAANTNPFSVKVTWDSCN